MKRQFYVTEDYLYIPICKEAGEKLVSFLVQKDEGEPEKLTQYQIPVDMEASETYAYDFLAEIPIGGQKGRMLIVEAEVTETFLDAICISAKKNLPKASDATIHFAAQSGWTNDPNGLVYQDGIYHFYFQHNPVGIAWNNMTWGHAVSRDLLHWEQIDMAMTPDEEGTMFTGCGLVNEREMLRLPKDALLFYYTAAGGTNEWSAGKGFTQRIAYSLDNGRTLVKIEEPCIPELCPENRDPKIFWHEPTQAYIMVLYMRGDEYAVFRSTDLKNWNQTQSINLKDAWECPDLFCLTSEEGETCWFFWSADGFYYAGDFNGYQFAIFQEKHTAYFTKLPYAAQTYANVGDRVISIPWLRLKNDGRNFTGSYGIPVELTFEKTEDDEYRLIQKPVRELLEQMTRVDDSRLLDNGNQIVYNGKDCKHALVVKMHLNSEFEGKHEWKINGMDLQYSAVSGEASADTERMMVGYGYSDVMMIIDDRILEVFFDEGRRYGAFVLPKGDLSFKVDRSMVDSFEFYEVL
ncbi:MAG: glycoside hydrolase family 32 protein [Lachnospiraceae bacterium]|nr:glycoside hydrolase family 32 protein [Lachnospiraceae bacterium]